MYGVREEFLGKLLKKPTRRRKGRSVNAVKQSADGNLSEGGVRG